eukprot:Nitzschia sp. Nitz4//scaffold337_size18511//6651//8344//NITZ4_008780-RA/size18511-processed-gene-0.8-mRNA-1//-1//CDS//3329548310//8131//frame0
MMMSNAAKKEEVTPADFSANAPSMSSVEELERKLQLLNTAEAPTTAAPPAQPAVSAPAAAPAAAAPTLSGKSALLARIQAAKEKSQQAQLKPPPPAAPAAPAAPVDLLSSFDAPAKESDPPPSYDAQLLPPPPPPEQPAMFFAPPPPMDAVMEPPPPVFAPPAASAPALEDLLDSAPPAAPPQHFDSYDMPAPMAPPMAPPTMAPPGIDEDILAALDPSEREAILEEQRKIMEQIESDKANDNASSAAARAMAFDQRSSASVAKVAGQFDRPRAAPPARASAKPSPSRVHGGTAGSRTVDLGAGEEVPLFGQDKTQKAIAEGNSMVVQCLNCQSWMQVTKDATLMLCPTCQVVTPVLAESAATSAELEVAAQEAADAQLAEKLQAEEYGRAGGGASSSKKKKTAPKAAKLEKGQAVEQSWYDWFMGTPAPDAPAAPVPERGSAELPSRQRGLVAASTGAESYAARPPPSYQSSGARVAESKSMFSCVADAVGTAATSMYAINQDDEGNVHGVDSSGLLAMPNVSRQREE